RPPVLQRTSDLNAVAARGPASANAKTSSCLSRKDGMNWAPFGSARDLSRGWQLPELEGGALLPRRGAGRTPRDAISLQGFCHHRRPRIFASGGAACAQRPHSRFPTGKRQFAPWLNSSSSAAARGLTYAQTARVRSEPDGRD